MPAAKGMPRGCRTVWQYHAAPGLVLSSGDLVEMPSDRRAVFIGVNDKRRDVLFEFEYIDPDTKAPPPRQGGDRELSMRVSLRNVRGVTKCSA